MDVLPVFGDIRDPDGGWDYRLKTEVPLTYSIFRVFTDVRKTSH